MMTTDFEDQLDQIRAELYQKTKDMSTKDAVAAINADGKRVAEKYGIPVKKGTPARPAPQAKAL